MTLKRTEFIVSMYEFRMVYGTATVHVWELKMEPLVPMP